MDSTRPVPSTDADVTVLGAGILGSAIAYHLALHRGLTVRLYEGNAGPAATFRSAGILTHVGWEPWDLEIIRRSAAEISTIAEALGTSDYLPNGGLRVARTPEGEAWLEKAQGVLSRAGVENRTIDADGVGALLPVGDFADVRKGLHTPTDGVFDAGGLVESYQRMATGLGATIERGETPGSIRPSSGGWQIRTPSATIRTRELVLACGAWTKKLLGGLGYRLPAAPFRTQAANLRPSPLTGGFPTLHDLDLEMYIRPTASGHVVVGDGNEPREADPDTANLAADRQFVERMIRDTQTVFPGWSTLRAETSWAGVCVASPDRYPLVGRVPGQEGLHVATGFNGLGAMRAPGIACMLARAVAEGAWGPLEPADPGRIPRELADFDPRPEFPLEAEPREEAPREPNEAVCPQLPASARNAERIRERRLHTTKEVGELSLPPISTWFDPFLPLFMKDAIRTGGTVEVSDMGGEVRGVFLYSPGERVGSVFTKTRDIASRVLPARVRGGVYAERAWVDGGEPIAVMLADVRDWQPRTPSRNPVRIARQEDLRVIMAMMRELEGDVDVAWFRTLPRPEEICFMAEVEGRVAGVSWASVVGTHARGHSFMVHPRYRGLGIGTDLLHARMIWLKDLGVRTVVSEIYAGNAASQTAAERAGMAEVGQMFHFHPPKSVSRSQGSDSSSGGPTFGADRRGGIDQGSAEPARHTDGLA